MDNQQIRSFIAIELPPALKKSIGEFQSVLKKPAWNFVKWVKPDLMHLTLKFLGNQSTAKLDVVKEVLSASTAAARAFILSTGQTGSFPGGRRIRVFWLGLEGDIEKLVTLQKSIDSSLVSRGFPSEERPFTAHLTLARLREECSLQEKTAFAEAIQGLRFEPPYSFSVDRIFLMKSTLTPKGPVYTKLAEYRFSI